MQQFQGFSIFTQCIPAQSISIRIPPYISTLHCLCCNQQPTQILILYQNLQICDFVIFSYGCGREASLMFQKLLVSETKFNTVGWNCKIVWLYNYLRERESLNHWHRNIRISFDILMQFKFSVWSSNASDKLDISDRLIIWPCGLIRGRGLASYIHPQHATAPSILQPQYQKPELWNNAEFLLLHNILNNTKLYRNCTMT